MRPGQPKDFWYYQAMKNVEETVKEGGRPTIAELVSIAKLEQLHRIADALGNKPRIREAKEIR